MVARQGSRTEGRLLRGRWDPADRTSRWHRDRALAGAGSQRGPADERVGDTAAFRGAGAASQHDPALAAGLRERFIARQRLAATELLRLIAEENTEREAVAPDIAIDLICGSLYYRLLISNARFDGTNVNSILDAVLHPDH
ncbi:TetR-like C-terminal domain-containing protein [Galactobacter caseinivorans]|uniref:Tetracyclin repressor-like C-terminal domain-containing protein n=1 Tax=Galactobacter caseinivorans TaxID=2676123 RepID=A0A496PK15_9MICC|nr:hypothetical protein DWQ67_07015 [Galactobacter caseinivorans]